MLPAPPKPPTPNTSDGFLPLLVGLIPPETLTPPPPPPPPIDAANRPAERLPEANRSPSTLTSTVPAVPPSPPKPPTPATICPSVEIPPETLIPPAPPPPPIDSAATEYL